MLILTTRCAWSVSTFQYIIMIKFWKAWIFLHRSGCSVKNQSDKGWNSSLAYNKHSGQWFKTRRSNIDRDYNKHSLSNFYGLNIFHCLLFTFRSLLRTGEADHLKAVVKFLAIKKCYRNPIYLHVFSLCAGLHRYIFLAYKQPNGKIVLDEPKLATISTG
jgi:hypothetical protein